MNNRKYKVGDKITTYEGHVFEILEVLPNVGVKISYACGLWVGFENLKMLLKKRK